MGDHLTSAGFLLSNNYSQRMLQLKEKATLTLLQIHKKQKKIPFSIPIQQILCMHNQFCFLCYSFDLCTKKQHSFTKVTRYL